MGRGKGGKVVRTKKFYYAKIGPKNVQSSQHINRQKMPKSFSPPKNQRPKENL